ncbi:ADK2 [[Candida] subhashii]|uniref:GTP:AMP phosphotransferase, mitochondrial n=1 Tax=[Candida] subhashii TaxID=561895 RepID=A0A8J5QZF0_9ASCO|nr:ADK2 [[Candida] subhashii]KAG7664405.1 ADK2 [[Candida] subhashii]
MNKLRPIRILLLGAPGSGKGTQTSRLLKQFNQLESLSSGDILRSQIDAGSEIGKEASDYISRGELVPDSTMVSLITNHLKTSNWLRPESNWLLDGFPRTYNQALKLDEALQGNQANLNMVVELDVDQKVILQRIENRWIHPSSGRVYNLDYDPPKVPFKDDITGEPLVKRKDDTVEVFQKRLDQYNKTIEPLKEFYNQKNILYSIEGNTSDIIYPKLQQLILNKFT